MDETVRETLGRTLKIALAFFIVLAVLYATATKQVNSQRAYVRGVLRADEVDLLARLVAAEAEGEPYAGQVAVAAVILNRVQSPQFPNSISGVAYQPHAFESVTNGLIWWRTPSAQARNAAIDALNGWDPTYGSTFFWNPSKPVSPWIWTRTIVTQIGNHVFGY